MRFSESPTIATWLLDHFGPGPGNDAILGDLIEQYRSGRSRAWYWRQVIVAIAVGIWKEIASHKMLACRAFVMLWGILFIEIMIIRYTIITLNPNSASVYRFFSASDHRDWWLYYSDIFRSSLFWLPFVAQFIAAGFSGWISARLHRPFERSFILGWLATCIVALPVHLFVLITDGPARLHGLIIAILWNSLTIAGALMGGLYFVRPTVRTMAAIGSRNPDSR